MSISGNINALLQVRSDGGYNAIGERLHSWSDVAALKGWLDLSAGDSKYSNFMAKVQESTHIFLCDHADLKNLGTGWIWNTFNLNDGVIRSEDQKRIVDLTSENGRMIIDGGIYDILLIDNPMGMNHHLEFYLKYVGGQNGRTV